MRAIMFATRCKLRWPGAVTTVGSSSTFLARPTLPGHLSRCVGTAASSEAGRDEQRRDSDEGDISGRHQSSPGQRRLPNKYTPLAYEPMPMSYADLLSRAISAPVLDSSGTLRQLHRALQPYLRDPGHDHSRTEDAPLQPEPEGASLPLYHVVDRSIRYFTTQNGQIQGALSAVAQDVSSDAVPKAYTQNFDAIRAHHLGRWYAKTLASKYERGRIRRYLNNVADTTEKARNIIILNSTESINKSLNAQKAALTRAIRRIQPEFEAVVYAMVCELRAARRAQQWHRVWTLERKVASTASMFLVSQTPLSVACHNFFNRDDERMVEISMSRMAEWNDSYQQMYEADVQTRKRMNLVKRYWTVFNSSQHEKPWQGEAVVFTAKSPTTNAKEIIVIRHDQSMPPKSLWPRVWRPKVLGGIESPAGLSSDVAAPKMKRRTIRTPGGTGRRPRRKERTGTGPRGENPQQFLSAMHAISDAPEA